jgi:hypothetical protein
MRSPLGYEKFQEGPILLHFPPVIGKALTGGSFEVA